MTTPAADDYEAIRRRLEELAAEKNLALTGSSAPEKPTENEYLGEAAIGWPYAPTGFTVSTGEIFEVTWTHSCG